MDIPLLFRLQNKMIISYYILSIKDFGLIFSELDKVKGIEYI
jgi:hypothetical protein